MPDYNWTCHACESVNAASHNICSNCGLPANASANDLERHLDPIGHEKKKQVAEHQIHIHRLALIPFFGVILIANGKYDLFLLFLVLAFFAVQKNIKLLKAIWSNEWANKTLLTWSIGTAVLIALRVVAISEEGRAIFWFTVVFLCFHIYFVHRLFYSARGKQFFSHYHEIANK